MYDIALYLADIEEQFKTGVAKEHSYRPALKKLFESIDAPKPIIAINEPKRDTFGAPDFMIKSGDAVIGFAEAKDIGINRLDNLSDREIEQKSRYLAALPNLIYTDYLEFRFYQEGKETARVRIAEFDGKTITPLPERYQTLVDLIKDFYVIKTATIKSPLKLAELMAGKARLIADVIKGALRDQSENQSLYEQLESFRKILIRTMTEQEFADIYAQTIAYGMFVARLHDKTMHDFTRQEAATLIPKTVPFLRKMFDYIAGNDIDERIVWSVDSLASRTESFDFFFEVSKFSGQIRNCEGDKCADMQYFTIDEIKNLKNVVSTTRISLANIAKGQIYSECKSYKSATR